SHQADILLRGRQRDLGCGRDIGGTHLDHIAHADVGVRPDESVEPDNVEPLIFGKGRQGHRGRRTVSRDLDYLTLLEAQLFEGGAGKSRRAFTNIAFIRPGYLKPDASGGRSFSHGDLCGYTEKRPPAGSTCSAAVSQCDLACCSSRMTSSSGSNAEISTPLRLWRRRCCPGHARSFPPFLHVLGKI